MRPSQQWTRHLTGLAVAVTTLLLAAVALAQESAGSSSVEYRTLFDPESPLGQYVTPRTVVWILAQLHLLFAAFVLAVPMFVVIIELMSILSKDAEQAKRYDKLGHEFCKLLTTAFSVTSIIGAIFTFVCLGLYPKFFNYLADVFGPSMYLYACIFFGESFSLYLYYYGWGKFKKWTHLGLGISLNFFGIVLMLIANAWTTFTMAPAGLNDAGEVISRYDAFFNFLLHPINIHRLIANLCMGGSVAAAYAAYKFLTTQDPEKKAHYDWMGYIGNFIAVLALLPLPFAGYYLGFEIYQFNQQLGIYMMGGVLSWLFVLQAVLIGALFFAANYYLWLGMDRIDGAERYRGWIKFLLGVITVCVLVWATPKSLILTSAEIDAMGGTNHSVLSIFGVMSAKNTAVNLIILATFLSFLLYRRGNKQPTVSWAKTGTAIQALAFGIAAAVVIVIGVGGYIPGWWMESSKRIAMSPYQVLAVIACIFVVMPVDIGLMRGAKEIGKIRWGQVSKASQYTLFFLAVSFTWLMALMGFVRSSLRQNWHVYEVMQDTSPEAYTPAIGYATVIVTVVVMLFFALVAMIVWIANLGSEKEVVEKPPVPTSQRMIRLAVGAGVVVLVFNGLASLFHYEKPKEPNKDLIAEAERSTKMLEVYDVLDPEKGVYQVPIDRTMAMMVNNPTLLEAPVTMRVDLDEMSPAERGEYLFQKSDFACGACHSVDGSAKQAPTMLGRFGKPTSVSDNSNPTFDIDYVWESLQEPELKYATGYDPKVNPGAPVMPSFKGNMSKQQFDDLMAYLQSL